MKNTALKITVSFVALLMFCSPCLAAGPSPAAKFFDADETYIGRDAGNDFYMQGRWNSVVAGDGKGVTTHFRKTPSGIAPTSPKITPIIKSIHST